MSECIVCNEPKDITEKLDEMCDDFDEDCKYVVNKVKCWLHAPECGLCPFLQNNKSVTSTA